VGRTKAAPANSRELLESVAARPADIVALFAAALRGPGKASIEQALRDDSAVRTAYRTALRDLAALDETPWVVSFAGRLGVADACPELLAIAKADAGSKSEQAAQALLKIGDRAALAQLVEGIEMQRLVLSPSIEALFVLGDAIAFERLAPLVANGSLDGSLGLWHLAKHADLVTREPRWKDVAVEALARPATAEAARAVVLASLSPDEQRSRLGHLPRAVVTVDEPESALRGARAQVAEALAKLAGLPPPDANVQRRLTELKALLGRVPPVVWALHERVDGVELAGPTAGESVTLYGTETILASAREWDRCHRPRESPALLVPTFQWPVAPDGYTRGGFSGGPAYGFELPGAADDPALANTPKKPTYLAFVTRELKRRAKLLAARGWAKHSS
jgi:hypothetical protein